MRISRDLSNQHWVVLTCQGAMTAVVATWALDANWLSFAVGAMCLVLSATPALCLRESALRGIVSLVMALLLAAHVLLGMYLGLYELSSIYDKFMHVIGSTAIAVIVYAALDAYCRQRSLSLPWALRAATVFSVTLSSGVFWEFFEFGVDQTGLFYAQRGLTDTMIDLFADGLGAVIAILLFLPGRAPFSALLPRKQRRTVS